MQGQFSGLTIDGGAVHRIDAGGWVLSGNGTGITVGANSYVADVYIDRMSINASSVAKAANGILLKNVGGIHLTDSTFANCTYGLRIRPDANQSVHFGFFSGGVWDTCGDRCIYISAPEGSAVHSMVFNNCWSATCPNETCTIAGIVDGCSFMGHRFLNSQNSYGLYVVGPAKNVYVDASIAYGCPNAAGYCFTGATDFAVRNSFAGIGGYTGTTLSSPNLYGMIVAAGCNNYVISANIFRGNTAAALVDNGGVNKEVFSNLLT
jgi:hypothetical protein